jgi:hypothetical protein
LGTSQEQQAFIGHAALHNPFSGMAAAQADLAMKRYAPPRRSHDPVILVRGQPR